MSQKNIDKKQYLRYMKTFLWAMKKDMDTVLQVSKKGKMEDYPVDAKTLEDTVNAIETGEGLRSTNVSSTDLWAILEVLKHKEKEVKDKKEI